jgi:hypothetical protein
VRDKVRDEGSADTDTQVGDRAPGGGRGGRRRNDLSDGIWRSRSFWCSGVRRCARYNFDGDRPLWASATTERRRQGWAMGRNSRRRRSRSERHGLQTPDEMIFEMVRSPQDRSFGGTVLLSDVERQKWPPRRRRHPGPLTFQGVLFVPHAGIAWEHLPRELDFDSGTTRRDTTSSPSAVPTPTAPPAPSTDRSQRPLGRAHDGVSWHGRLR